MPGLHHTDSHCEQHDLGAFNRSASTPSRERPHSDEVHKRKHRLRIAGRDASLSVALGTALYRRTWSTKTLLKKAISLTEQSLRMGQNSLDPSLPQVVYRPDHLPPDTNLSGESSSSYIQDQLAEVGAVRWQVKAKDLSRDQLDRLRDLSTRFFSNINHAEVASEMVMVFASVNRGHRLSVSATARAINELLNDEGKESVQQRHVFLEECRGSLRLMLGLGRDPRFADCLSCLGIAQPLIGSSSTKQMPSNALAIKVNECLAARRHQSFCFMCWNRFPAQDITAHVADCLLRRRASVSGVLAKNNFVCVTGPTSWRSPEFRICPFTVCMASSGAEAPMPQIQVLTSHTGTPLTGNNAVRVFQSDGSFRLHVHLHCFQRSGICWQTRSPLPTDGRVSCGILGCHDTFCGPIERLVHLWNEHQLPIFCDKKGSHIKTVTLSQLGQNWTPVSFRFAREIPAQEVLVHTVSTGSTTSAAIGAGPSVTSS